MKQSQLAFVLFLLLPIQSCYGQVYDGEHCASVTYHNSKTGKGSLYTLLVEAQDEKLIRIKWPSGGWLDNSHFVNPTFDDRGFTSFVTFDGRKYEVLITGDADGCFANSPKLAQCLGTTKSGNRCRRMTDDENGYCYQH